MTMEVQVVPGSEACADLNTTSVAYEFGCRKRRKTRRGRRDRNGSSTKFMCEICGQIQSKNIKLTLKVNRRKVLRPGCCPRAPKNWTQFIIDDVNARSDLDVSVESPDASPQRGSSPGAQSSREVSPAYSDIDYEYEPNGDTDCASFMIDDFETVFQSARLENLQKRSKEELLTQILQLEDRAFALEDEISELEILRREREKLVKQNAQMSATAESHLDTWE